jgi:sarcosine oxidase
MAAAGAPFEDLDLAETRKRAPALETGSASVFEPESGVLAADRCLAALRQSALAAGAHIREGSRVTHVSEAGGRVLLTTDDVTVSASVAVICAGHWTSNLVSTAGIGLRLVPTLEQVAYLSPIPGRESAASVPVFIERASPWVYGLPSGTSGLLKVALHRAGPVADPDTTPLVPDPELLSRIAEHCARLLPSHHLEPVSTERCFYDSSPDEDFVVDRVGRIVIGAGTTGHGFKFGPLFGELLADLATGIPPQISLERFRADRPAVTA